MIFRTALRRPASLSFIALFAVIGMLALQSAAVAHDHVPPETELLANGATLQQGELSSYCWIAAGATPGTGVGTCADGVFSFPSARVVAPGTHVTLRILKAQKPRQLTISAWSKLNRHGVPVWKTGTDVRYKRHPVHLASGRAWDFTFVLADNPRHYYLEVFGVWRDVDAGGGDQDASWMFHLRTSA
ncbi:MAG TPA: hypothetical protein VF660_06180 [Actinomycetota bacterium]|jgi:hypothetical protein